MHGMQTVVNDVKFMTCKAFGMQTNASNVEVRWRYRSISEHSDWRALMEKASFTS